MQQPDHGVRRRIKSREWQEGTEERDGIREVEMGNEQLPLSCLPSILFFFRDFIVNMRNPQCSQDLPEFHISLPYKDINLHLYGSTPLRLPQALSAPVYGYPLFSL